MKYKKKPVIIEAIQFEDTAERICELSEFMGGAHVIMRIKIILMSLLKL